MPERRLRRRIRRNILTGMEESEIMKHNSTVFCLVASGNERVMHVHGPLKWEENSLHFLQPISMKKIFCSLGTAGYS